MDVGDAGFAVDVAVLEGYPFAWTQTRRGGEDHHRPVVVLEVLRDGDDFVPAFERAHLGGPSLRVADADLGGVGVDQTPVDGAREGSRRCAAPASSVVACRYGSSAPAMTSTCAPRTAPRAAGTASREPSAARRIWAGGVERHVTVEDADEAVLDEVDAGYRPKYGRRYASIVDTINDKGHRATTLRLVPQ